MDRDNEAWVAELTANEPTAISDLRAIMVRNLRKSLAHRSGIDQEFVEDAAQESLIRILDKLNQFSGRSRFVTWATSIAIHQAMNKLRRSRWKDVSLDSIVADATFEVATTVDHSLSNDFQTERQAILAAMQNVIETGLTEKQRTALLAELKGMSQAAIAEQLGTNRNTIYKLTHDARKRLRQGLESLGFTVENVLELINR